MFPTDETRGNLPAQARAAAEAFRKIFIPPEDALAVHGRHAIRTARGKVVGGEALDATI